MRLLKSCLVMLLFSSSLCFGFFLDGEGHYAVLGQHRTKPLAGNQSSSHSAFEQSFRLLGEARINESSSFFLEFRLFDNPRKAFLGDQSDENVFHPEYSKVLPSVSKFYIRYAFEYFMLEAGRRDRHWGLGILYNAGNNPFDSTYSIYDGIEASVNIQKFETIGFSVGFDKIAETGNKAPGESDKTFGASNNTDDISQFHMAIEYDDRKVSAASTTSTQVGATWARVFADRIYTSLNFVDLYLNLYFGESMTWKNELLIEFGSTESAASVGRGARPQNQDSDASRNEVEGIAFAGEFEWLLHAQGEVIGPEKFRQGDRREHSVFLQYAYAPGDSDGYYSEEDGELGKHKRDRKSRAIPLNKNFKPAMILFNGRDDSSNLKVDGIFDTYQVVNSFVFGLGYRYKDLLFGDFEGKIIYARLLEGLPDDVKAHYENNLQKKNPVGMYGKNLGVELDLSYQYSLSHNVKLGGAAAVLLSGDAWKTTKSFDPATSFLFQASLEFLF